MKYIHRPLPEAESSEGHGAGRPAAPARSRPGDGPAESAALLRLAERIAARPASTLRFVAEEAMAACAADSAGLCLVDAARGMTRCRVALGQLAALQDGSAPLQDSPCREAIEQGSPTTLSRPGRRFAALAAFEPPIDAVLMAPMLADGVAIGVLWVAASQRDGDALRRFDAEDSRQLGGLARIAQASVGREGGAAAAPPPEARHGLPGDDPAGSRSARQWQQHALRLESELAALQQLHRLDAGLAVTTDLARALDGILEALMSLTGADAGEVQLLQGDGSPSIAAQRAADPAALARLQAAAAASEAGPPAEAQADWPKRRQSTPLRGRAGERLGSLVLFFDTPREPSEHHQRLLELAARQCADMVDRLRTRDALRDSEQTLQVAIEAADFGIWEWDVPNDETRWSPNFMRLLGYDEPQPRWSMASFTRHIVEEDVPVFQAALRRALAEGELRYEIRVRHRRAGVHWISTVGRVVFDSAGHALRVSGVTIDNSQQHAREQALRDSEAQFRSIFEVTSVGVAQADAASGQVVRANSRLAHMLGYDEGELLGRPFIELAHRDDRTQSQLGYLQLMRGDLPSFDVEQRMLCKDGQFIWVLTSMNLIRGAQGAIRGLVALLMDITERKLAEEALAASQLQLRLALDASRLALWESDMSGSRMAWSPAVFNLTGLPREAFDPNADDLSRFVHPDDAYIVDAALQRASLGQPFQIEYRIIRADGQVRWVAKHGRVVRNRQGLPHRMIGTVADITGRKTFEEELRRARDDLEANVHERTLELARAIATLRLEVGERTSAEQRVRSLLGRLVGAVEEERHRISRDLHDTLGQHLSELMLGLQAMAREADAQPWLLGRVGDLLRATQRMEEEVDRISHELRPLALDEMSLDDALRRHAETWSSESGIAIDLYTHGLMNGRFVPTIESTVYRVVQESLTNIRKHAEARRVSLIAERRSDELRVIVEDDGKGFDNVSTDGDAESRGRLGLKGMNERAALVGGQLQIESAPQSGTTVYLTIPLDRNAWTPDSTAT